MGNWVRGEGIIGEKVLKVAIWNNTDAVEGPAKAYYCDLSTFRPDPAARIALAGKLEREAEVWDEGKYGRPDRDNIRAWLYSHEGRFVHLPGSSQYFFKSKGSRAKWIPSLTVVSVDASKLWTITQSNGWEEVSYYRQADSPVNYLYNEGTAAAD